MTINKVISASTRDFADAVKWAAKTSGGQIRMDIGREDTVLYFSSFVDTNSSKAKIDISFVSGKQGNHSFVVSSSLLMSSLKLIKGNEFTITVSSSQMVIKSGRSVVNLPIIKGGNEILVPDLPAVAGRVSISDFRKAISSVTLAAANDDTAIALMSIHSVFSPKNKTLTFVATDRYKMMLRTIPFEPIADEDGNLADDFSMNIMASSMKTLISGLPTTDATIDLHTAPGGAQLVIRDVNYMTGVGVIDGEFVKYEGFLAMPFVNTIKVELAELKGAIEGIATLLTSEEGITLTFSDGECVVSSVNNVGSTVIASEGVIAPVGENDEPSLRVVFGSKIIRPVLSSVSSKFIELHYNKPTTPWVIKEIDEATGKAIDTSFTLLMPVRA